MPELRPPDDGHWRLDDWADLIRAHFVSLDIRPTDEAPFRGAVDVHRIGPLSVGRVRSVPQQFRRTPTLVRHDDEQFLQVGYLRRGSAGLEQDGRRCRLGPGSLAVYDTSRPFVWTMTEPWVMDVFTWPQALLGTVSTTAVTATVPGGPGSAIAGAALRQAGAPADDVEGAAGDGLALALMDLVLGAARAEHPPPGEAGALPAVLAFIETHLRDPDLDPAFVARGCHLSLRALHRLFVGRSRGVAGVIRLRRLEAARRALRQEPRRAVGSVAAEFCFSDASVFARSFREEYGQSPRAWRSAR